MNSHVISTASSCILEEQQKHAFVKMRMTLKIASFVETQAW